MRSAEIDCSDIDEQTIAEHLDTAGLPDPDLLTRTAGEMRIRDFLLWQISYAELWVTQEYWPEFDEATLHAAIRDYASRVRRFGGLDFGWRNDRTGFRVLGVGITDGAIRLAPCLEAIGSRVPALSPTLEERPQSIAP